MAGLPGSRAMVGVGPPLSSSGPSFASMPTKFPSPPFVMPTAPSPTWIRVSVASKEVTTSGKSVFAVFEAISELTETTTAGEPAGAGA